MRLTSKTIGGARVLKKTCIEDYEGGGGWIGCEWSCDWADMLEYAAKVTGVWEERKEG